MRKELRDYQRNRQMVVTMAIIPIVFLLQPLIYVLNLPASASVPLSHRHELLYLLGIPVLVPAVAAAASTPASFTSMCALWTTPDISRTPSVIPEK